MSLAAPLTAVVAGVAAAVLVSLPGPLPDSAGRPAQGTRTPDTRSARPSDPGWLWPLRPEPGVTRAFDPPEQRWLAGHRGVDLAASSGAQVRTPADGVVAFAGLVAGRPVIVVSHAGGLRSTFEPVEPDVDVGRVLARGASVGRLSPTGGHCAPARCLHWGVLRGSSYLDPLAFVSGGPVRLLPVS